LGLDHEEKVVASRRVVNWYNGSLDDDLNLETEFNISVAQSLLIVGNGNIFCDMARILLKKPKDLIESDIPEPVLRVLE